MMLQYMAASVCLQHNKHMMPYCIEHFALCIMKRPTRMSAQCLLVLLQRDSISSTSC